MAIPPIEADSVRPAKLNHNVRFAEFKRIQIASDLPELALAVLCFENVLIAGSPLKDFRSAYLNVSYRDPVTDEVIAQALPARWHESSDALINVGAGQARCAVIASCIGSKWTTDSLVDVPINPALEYGYGGSEFRSASAPLPIGRMKVEATLIGENNLSIPKVEGILTLGENGAASFSRLS